MDPARWKEHLKIRKLTEFKGDMSKASIDIAPQSCQIFQALVR